MKFLNPNLLLAVLALIFAIGAATNAAAQAPSSTTAQAASPQASAPQSATAVASASTATSSTAAPVDAGTQRSDKSNRQCEEKFPGILGYAILIGITLGLVWALNAIASALKSQGWKLAEALSEEAQLPPGAPAPAAGQNPPILPSASRLIALIGTVIMGSFFVGLGYYVLWQVFHGQSLDAAKNAWSFFASGAALFLPYGVNKLTNIGK